MQLIPKRPHPFMATLAGIVIPEALHNLIPKRVESLDQQGFTQSDPDVVNRQIAALKISYPQIVRCLYAFRVLLDPVVQGLAVQRRIAGQSLASASRNGFADVYGMVGGFDI